MGSQRETGVRADMDNEQPDGMQAFYQRSHAGTNRAGRSDPPAMVCSYRERMDSRARWPHRMEGPPNLENRSGYLERCGISAHGRLVVEEKRGVGEAFESSALGWRGRRVSSLSASDCYRVLMPCGPHLVHIPSRKRGHERETTTNEYLV